MLSARAARESGGFTAPFDHMVLRVELDEPWLADVGWGLGWPPSVAPQHGRSAARPGRPFSIVDVGDDEIDMCRDGKTSYRVEARARELTDFVPTCWWQQTHRDSVFTKGPTCSLPTANGRVTLAGDKLIRTAEGERTEEHLAGADAILAGYSYHFGFSLPRVPEPPAALGV